VTDPFAILPLFGAVFVASLVGSGHCVGMCGAFVTLAVTGHAPEEAARARHRLAAAYHLGRLLSYSTLGVVAGMLGAAFDLGGTAIGLQRGAIVVAGALMLVFASIMLLRMAGVRLPRLPLPARLTGGPASAFRSLLTRLHRLAWTLAPLPRAGAIGLLTPLLPCGWLYAFVITAAGTAHPLVGALVMAAFWAGTVPALAILGVGVQWIAGPLKRHLPFVTAVLIAAVGLWMLLVPAALPAIAASGADAPTSIDEAVTRVRDLDQSTLPCCRDD